LQVFRWFARRAGAWLHTREVAGSKPAAPIVSKARYGGLEFGYRTSTPTTSRSAIASRVSLRAPARHCAPKLHGALAEDDRRFAAATQEADRGLDEFAEEARRGGAACHDTASANWPTTSMRSGTSDSARTTAILVEVALSVRRRSRLASVSARAAW
jgi:hypothetical protein